MLCNGSGIASHTASDIDTMLFCIIQIDIIRSDTEFADRLQIRTALHHFSVHFIHTDDNGIGILRQCFKLLMCICLTRGIVMYLQTLGLHSLHLIQTVIRKPSRGYHYFHTPSPHFMIYPACWLILQRLWNPYAIHVSKALSNKYYLQGFRFHHTENAR